MIRTFAPRILWYGLAAVIAMVAYSVEIDRQSQNDPDLARMVPGPFRATAQQQIVAELIKGTSAPGTGDPELALAEARRLVRRRPIPGENLFLLSLATYQSGDQEDGLRVMGLSGERGWRTPLIQQAMIEFALSNNMVDVAAARLLAIWSIAETEEDVNTLKLAAPKVLAAQGGPEALGKFLAASRFAQASVLREARSIATPDQFARMIGAAAHAGADFDCDMLEQQVWALAQRGNGQAAQAIVKPAAHKCPKLGVQPGRPSEKGPI